MNTRAKIFAAAFALAAAAGVNAQNSAVDKAFTANGTSCADVNWSAETLAKYPNISKSCQSVMTKDGTTYVRFDGTVKKVAKGGSEVTMQMKGTNAKLVLNPDPNKTVNIGGKKTPVKQLRPGDTLTFYVPDSRLVAAVVPTPEEIVPAEEVPIIAPPVEQMAMTQEPLPKTASSWPLVALLGAMSIGLALVMRTRRVFGSR
jgi:LPXTG-motif cell wall-anchored protein